MGWTVVKIRPWDDGGSSSEWNLGFNEALAPCLVRRVLLCSPFGCTETNVVIREIGKQPFLENDPWDGSGFLNSSGKFRMVRNFLKREFNSGNQHLDVTEET